jgi:ABC-type nitrate/sulfonate/bicarbonate transport system substrate-binding protein
MSHRLVVVLSPLAVAAAIAACSGAAPGAAPGAASPRTAAGSPASPAEVTLMLDWVPNTNHTGLFVADRRGYFADAGLKVQIIQPGEVMAQQAVASGAADFGVDFQEQVTMARADGRPLVSIAAVIQHNTSGFAARRELGASAPADWEGLTYGSFGSPFEEPTLDALMACDGGRFERLKIVNVGLADPLALLATKQIDLAWIFYGWQGIQAEQQGIGLDLTAMSDWFGCVPDYYTPILIASEDMIARRPEVVRAFLGAVARGYDYAIAQPEAAAEILLAVAPELDRQLVMASQAWLSPRYAADSPRWGEQRREVWEAYATWMHDRGVVPHVIDVDAAFTNEFLP